MPKTLFFPAKDRKLADTISIISPEAFRASIRELKDEKGYVTPKERKALQLAQNRAKAQLNRKDLSAKERMQMREIARIRIPPQRK